MPPLLILRRARLLAFQHRTDRRILQVRTGPAPVRRASVTLWRRSTRPASARSDVAAERREQLAPDADARWRPDRRPPACARPTPPDRPARRAGRPRRRARMMSPSRSLAIGPPSAASGRHVDRRRHLARGARHAAVGDQRDLAARGPAARRAAASACAAPACRWPAGPGSAPRRRSRGRARPRLNAACSSSWSSNTRAGASITWCSGVDRRDLDHRAAEIARRAACRPPSGWNGSAARRRIVVVARCAPAPSRQTSSPSPSSLGSCGVAAQARAPRRCARRRAAGRRRAARGSGSAMPPAAWKWFTSAVPFGIDAGQQRHRPRTRSAKSSQVEQRCRPPRAMATRCMRVVGRAAGGQQADDAVDDGPLVDARGRSACSRCRAR